MWYWYGIGYQSRDQYYCRRPRYPEPLEKPFAYKSQIGYWEAEKHPLREVSAFLSNFDTVF
jgi:hypothetical protein